MGLKHFSHRLLLPAKDGRLASHSGRSRKHAALNLRALIVGIWNRMVGSAFLKRGSYGR